MIGAIIGLIILTCIMLSGLLWVGQQLIAPLAEPFKTAIHVLMVLLVVVIAVWFLIVIPGYAGIHVPWPAGAGVK